MSVVQSSIREGAPSQLEESSCQAAAVFDGRGSHPQSGGVPSAMGYVQGRPDGVVLRNPGSERSHYEGEDFAEVAVLVPFFLARAVQVRGLVEGGGDVSEDWSRPHVDRDVGDKTATILRSRVGESLYS